MDNQNRISKERLEEYARTSRNHFLRLANVYEKSDPEYYSEVVKPILENLNKQIQESDQINNESSNRGYSKRTVYFLSVIILVLLAFSYLILNNIYSSNQKERQLSDSIINLNKSNEGLKNEIEKRKSFKNEETNTEAGNSSNDINLNFEIDDYSLNKEYAISLLYSSIEINDQVIGGIFLDEELDEKKYKLASKNFNEIKNNAKIKDPLLDEFRRIRWQFHINFLSFYLVLTDSKKKGYKIVKI